MHQTIKFLLLTGAALLTVTLSRSQSICLKTDSKVHCNLPEPSDITVASDKINYLVVSDHGILYKMSPDGKIISEAKTRGADFEGLCLWNNKIYVSEESFRKIMVYDEATLNYEYSYPVQWSGGRNQGIEAITRNEMKQCFVLISEKNPCVIFEMDSMFNIIHEYDSPSNEVSSACWKNGKLYILSDEAHTVYLLNPENYSVISSWNVPVTNPEGITFDDNGNMLILSDDRAMLFSFKFPAP